MKTATLFYFISAFFGIATIVGLFLGAYYDKTPLRKKRTFFWRFSWLMAALIFSLLQINGRSRIYNLNSEQMFWDKYRIPQIDSTMIYNYATKNSTMYLSYSNDSVLHRSKTVDYDLFDIYSVTDVFINRRDSLILTTTFINPNLLRDSSRTFTLDKGIMYKPTNQINKAEFDKTIKDWGLSDYLDKQFKVN
jgi:hypothetical protein